MTCGRCDNGVIVGELPNGTACASVCQCVAPCIRCGGEGTLHAFGFPIPGHTMTAEHDGLAWYSRAEIVQVPEPKGAYRYARTCPACRGVKVAEPTQSPAVRAFNAARVPAKFYRATLDSYQPTTPEQQRALDLVRDAIAHGGRTEWREVPAFVGPPGTGKTHLLCAAVRDLTLRRGRRAVFASFLDLCQSWRSAGYGPGPMDSQCSGADVLMLDDLRADGLNLPSIRERLESLVELRLNANRPTWWSANISPEVVAAMLGERLSSRLTGGYVVLDVLGPDGRQTEPTTPPPGAFDYDVPPDPRIAPWEG